MPRSLYLVSPLYYCVYIISNIEAAKILAVFPVPSISHQVVFRPITQELAKRGHEVTVITTDPAFPKDKAPDNLKEIDVHNVSYNMWIEKFTKAAAKVAKETQLEIFMRITTDIFEIQMNMTEVKEIFEDKNKTYDLLLLEACVRPGLVLSHILNTPVILISSLGATTYNFEAIGTSMHPTIYPGIMHKKTFNFTMWEKMDEVYDYFIRRNMISRHLIYENSIVRSIFGPDVPPLQEQYKNVDMLFLNSNPVFAGIVPVPPNVIYVGGLHQMPIKPLPLDLQNYLDSSINGVIYVSFGTNIDPSVFSPERVQTLVNVFSKLPYNVLFKWNNDVLPGKTENIKIAKWLPQSDLLKHPKIKVFITQAGLQSTDEAITAGVPLIAFPMIADQWFNADRYMYHEIGIKLSFETFTQQQLESAILTVINNESYHRNIVKLRNLIEDQPMKPLERAVWWTEYVIRHRGAKHLRSPAANISWAQYLELELVFTILAVLSITLTAIFVWVYYCLKRIFFRSDFIVSKEKCN